jgi:hypothetical protein
MFECNYHKNKTMSDTAETTKKTSGANIALIVVASIFGVLLLTGVICAMVPRSPPLAASCALGPQCDKYSRERRQLQNRLRVLDKQLLDCDKPETRAYEPAGRPRVHSMVITDALTTIARPTIKPPTVADAQKMVIARIKADLDGQEEYLAKMIEQGADEKIIKRIKRTIAGTKAALAHERKMQKAKRPAQIKKEVDAAQKILAALEEKIKYGQHLIDELKAKETLNDWQRGDLARYTTQMLESVAEQEELAAAVQKLEEEAKTLAEEGGE